tara:strand:- start:182 stop:931 length:750 start_codon:yes stop_codon:yes gene_type:complete
MKIFRSLRRKLVDSGKVKNYLIYAFGEILLIVIGILIAWKINDLNEIRKNKIVQVKIFESLYEELNTNITILDSAIVRYKSNKLALENSLYYVATPHENLTEETKDLLVRIKFKNSNLRNEALSSINISNKFQFIDNDSLTELIAEYTSEINVYKDQELKIRNIVENKLKPILEKHISLIEILPKENKNYNCIRTLGIKSDYTELLNNRDYQNSIIDQLMQTQIQVNIGINLRKKTQVLAFKLKKELHG